MTDTKGFRFKHLISVTDTKGFGYENLIKVILLRK